MSGYKRVNFYELCRLCATNQQKEKTHIFQEEGRKIQLQSKIQSCLSLAVYEHDFLPKVVCSKCLRTLEVCYSFRQECITSETMLSSYFKNFRYTEDFKKSGKVYIKDTSVKTPSPTRQLDDTVVSSTNSNTAQTAPTNTTYTVQQNVAIQADQTPKIQVAAPNQQIESMPFYTVHLPTIVANQQLDQKHLKCEPNKIVHNAINNTQVAYNLNTINLGAIKSAIQAVPKISTSESLGNVVVNANGEVINIGQLVDIETILNQAGLKAKAKPAGKRPKEKLNVSEEHIVKIDLTENETPGNYDTGQMTNKYDKLPHIKSTQNSKYTYAVKVEEKPQINSTVIFNTVGEYNQNSNNNSTYGYNAGGLYPTSNVNMINTNVVTSCSNIQQEHSTVNLNVLNQGLPDLNNQQTQTYIRNMQNNYPNIVSSKNSTIVQNNLNKSPPNPTSTVNAAELSNPSANPPPNQTQQPIKIHVCDVCHKSFKRREHLYQHVKLHTGFRPFTCENCNKSFMRKEHLLRHMTSHSGQKNFTCTICDKSFSRNDNLLKHRKTHDKQSVYTCEVCQKQFVMKHYYMAHKATHELEKCNVSGSWGLLKA